MVDFSFSSYVDFFPSGEKVGICLRFLLIFSVGYYIITAYYVY